MLNRSMETARDCGGHVGDERSCVWLVGVYLAHLQRAVGDFASNANRRESQQEVAAYASGMLV